MGGIRVETAAFAVGVLAILAGVFLLLGLPWTLIVGGLIVAISSIDPERWRKT